MNIEFKNGNILSFFYIKRFFNIWVFVAFCFVLPTLKAKPDVVKDLKEEGILKKINRLDRKSSIRLVTIDPKSKNIDVKGSGTIHDFGDVKSGKKPSHTFYFTNNTGKELKILKSRVPCGCADIKVSNRVLKPKEVIEFSVKLRSAGQSGKISKHFYLLTNSKKLPLIRYTLKANVISNPMPHCSAIRSIQIGVVKQNELKTILFDIKNIGDKSLNIYKGKIPDNLKLMTQLPLTIEPKKLKTFEAKFTAPNKIGKFNSELKLKTNDPKRALLLIVIRGEVVSDQ